MAAVKPITPETVTEQQLFKVDHPQTGSSGSQQLPAAQIAHDLANCLFGTRMLIESLSQILPDDPVLHERIGSTQRSALHANELCRLLQKTLVGGQNDLELNLCAIDIEAIVDSMRHLLEVMVRPGVKLHIDAAAGLSPITANPMQLRRVVLDLLTNASDALGSERGEITIRTGVFKWNGHPDMGLIAAADGIDSNDCVFLEIADTGCGIAEDKLPRIFEPTFTTKKVGQGLGLAAVQQIVLGCGGAITVDSCIGEGTRVRCIFPSASPEKITNP